MWKKIHTRTGIGAINIAVLRCIPHSYGLSVRIVTGMVMVFTTAIQAVKISCMSKIIYFVSFLFAILALSATLAHLFELPNKITLSRDDYFTVQQIYRGWSLFGIAVAGELISTLIFVILVRHQSTVFALALTSLICMVLTQVIFWVFTFPVNKVTNNWTQIPDQWEAWRRQWEYSHAASAVLNLIAVITLILSLLIPVRWVQQPINKKL